MLNAVKVPLIFLFIGSLLGVFLRLQFVTPTPGVNYTNFLHGHSHVMFLGWIFNILFIAFVTNHIAENKLRFFRNIFVIMQILVVGMLISFPLQGYGFFSILFSTLHTLMGVVFIIKFYNQTKSATSISLWYAKVALVFVLISAAGPFSLGYLMATGSGHGNLYNFSIYFYLHFQYNGFFLFGVLSLFFNLMEQHHIPFEIKVTKQIGIIWSVACVPAYILSVLWAKPGFVFNVVGGISALAQLFGLVLLTKLITEHSSRIHQNFKNLSVVLLTITLSALSLKLILQFISALPSISQMAYEVRPIVIAYLHLVLLGVISQGIFAWLFERKLVDIAKAKLFMILFIISFIGMEMCLILLPWWSSIFTQSFPSASVLILIFSVVLSLSFFLLLTSHINIGKIRTPGR